MAKGRNVMKKKALVLANFDLGLYNFRKELLVELIKNKYEVYISLPYGERVEDLKRLGCKFIDTPIDRRGMNPIIDVKLIFNYFKILLKFKPDMVLTYTIKPNIYGAFWCRVLKIPYIVNITGLGTVFQSDTLIKKIVIFLYKNSLKSAKQVLFENDYNKEYFIIKKIVDENKTFKLSGAGVNTDEYAYCPMEIKQELRFLFIGRIMKEKGIDELFEAIRNIKELESKNNFNYKIKFDLVGLFEDDYKDIVNELVKLGYINFYGFQKDVKPYIKKAHCIILPSYHEGMSNVLLEAASMGRPLITTDIPGCKEAVVDCKTGFLCKVKSTESLQNAIVYFINVSDNDKVKMGYESREHILNNFDRKEVIDNTISHIK